MSEWTETKAVLSEVEQLFNRDDDIRYIFDVKKMAKEIDSHCSSYLLETKEIIKKLTNRIVAKETEIIAPSEDNHSNRLEKIIAEKENIAGQLENVRETTDKKRENITKMAAQALSLREKGSEYTLSSQISDSRTAYALSLYAKISNVTWDYEVPAGKIGGCIGNDQERAFKNFSIDTRSKTSFEVANNLWDLIGEGFDPIDVK